MSATGAAEAPVEAAIAKPKAQTADKSIDRMCSPFNVRAPGPPSPFAHDDTVAFFQRASPHGRAGAKLVRDLPAPPVPAAPIRPTPIPARAPITDPPPAAAVASAAPDRAADIGGVLHEAVAADGGSDPGCHRHGLRLLRHDAHPDDQGEGGGDCENGCAHHT